MSRNLLKRGATHVDESGRVIDTNVLVTKRIEELAVRFRQAGGQGGSEDFIQGLAAEDVSALLMEESGGESSVIKKTGEDIQKKLEQARQDAESIIAGARAEAEQILQSARSQAEQEKKQVLEQARSQGYESGHKQAMQEAEKLKAELKKERKSLEAEFQKQIDTYEPEFIDTITGIYEYIFNVDLQSYRDILVHLITAAIRKVEMSQEFVVRVSKEDYPYVSMQKKQIAACAAGGSGSVVLTEDSTLRRNQCLIETDGGIFDCGLDTQLEELGKKLKLLSYEKR